MWLVESIVDWCICLAKANSAELRCFFFISLNWILKIKTPCCPCNMPSTQFGFVLVLLFSADCNIQICDLIHKTKLNASEVFAIGCAFLCRLVKLCFVYICMYVYYLYMSIYYLYLSIYIYIRFIYIYIYISSISEACFPLFPGTINPCYRYIIVL